MFNKKIMVDWYVTFMFKDKPYASQICLIIRVYKDCYIPGSYIGLFGVKSWYDYHRKNE